jgi:hypothetical protein
VLRQGTAADIADASYSASFFPGDVPLLLCQLTGPAYTSLVSGQALVPSGQGASLTFGAYTFESQAESACQGGLQAYGSGSEVGLPPTSSGPIKSKSSRRLAAPVPVGGVEWGGGPGDGVTGQLWLMPIANRERHGSMPRYASGSNGNSGASDNGTGTG